MKWCECDWDGFRLASTQSAVGGGGVVAPAAGDRTGVLGESYFLATFGVVVGGRLPVTAVMCWESRTFSPYSVCLLVVGDCFSPANCKQSP